MNHTATYSPEDNKLRLYPSARLDAETFARVKAAGFAWAPRQGLFVAPMWTPARADLLADLCGEIGDEDRTLVERAEERADRFDGYRDSRTRDAANAAEAARRLADGIPFGQPIMIGHHSQRRAERDAERIQSGMRRAVQMWDTADYWKRRAAGALAHAKYKELPAVRARRIKGLEADQRKAQATRDDAEKAARVWQRVPMRAWDDQTALATLIAGRISIGGYGLYSALADGRMHGDYAWRQALDACAAQIMHADRWLQHYACRLEYERAMLAEAGGLAAERFDIQPGGRVLVGAEWLAVVKLNKGAGGAVVSVSTNRRFVPIVGIEEVKDYREPDPEDAAKIAAASKLAPLVNYAGRGFVGITRAQWEEIGTEYKGTRDMGAGVDATRGGHYFDTLKDYREGSEQYQRHRVRVAMGTFLRRLVAPEVWAALPGDGANRAHGLHPVYLTDAKTTEPPRVGDTPKPRRALARKIAEAAGVDTSATPEPETPPPAATIAPTIPRIVEPALLPEPRKPAATPEPGTLAADVAAMRESLRTGVAVVSAPQLFPTPPDLAARMVEAADVRPGARVLEPSAGTGRILDAMRGAWVFSRAVVVAVELVRQMAERLPDAYPGAIVRCADFLACSVDHLGGLFDRVVMNPPFANGADVAHVTHAARMLKPGGRLVAVMSAGVTFRSDRRTAEFRRLVDDWGGTVDELPAGTFAASGTDVRSVLVVLDAPAAGAAIARASAWSSPAPGRLPVPAPYVVGHDPATVDEIARNEIRKRYHWAEGRPSAADFARAADGLDAVAFQPDAPPVGAGIARAAAWSRTAPPAEAEHCPTCDAPNAPEATRCTHCAESMSAPEPVPCRPEPENVAAIVRNTLRKRYEWAEGRPTAQDFATQADKLDAAARELDDMGDAQTAANYRAAAVLVRAEPEPPEWTHGGPGGLYPSRLYRCLAVFMEDDPGPCNAYMEAHEGAAVLKTERGRVYLVHVDDKGTSTAPDLADAIGGRS